MNPARHVTTRRVILSGEGPASGTVGVEGPRRRPTRLVCRQLSHREPALHPCAALMLLAMSPLGMQAQSTGFILPETSSTVTLSFTPDRDQPRDFKSILIRSGETTTRIVPRFPVLRIPASPKQRKEAFIWSADASGLKLDPSRYFLVGQYTADGLPHTLLFFLSAGFASDAAPLLVIAFSGAGKPYKLFEREYELTAFQQSGNGALLIGKATISQAICSSGKPPAPSSTTYDPYSVFQIRPGSEPKYLLENSRVYNRKHYVWAGPRSREDYAVIYNLPGQPRILGVPIDRHNELMSHLPCTP